MELLRKGFLSIFIFSSFLWTWEGPLYAKGRVEYSEAADVFELMDNLSSREGSTNSLYRKAFHKRFSLSAEEKSLLEKYGALRNKYRKKFSLSLKVNSKGRDDTQSLDIFTSRTSLAQSYDSFSACFYSSASLKEAFSKLKKKGVEKEDIQFLKEFYHSFRSKISSFIKESQHFSSQIFSFNRKWKDSGRQRALRLVKSFILGKGAKDFKLRILLVWAPPHRLPIFDIRGPYLIMRSHPLNTNRGEDLQGVHAKAIEAILMAQKKTQRENLSKIFREKCRGRSLELRESLALLFGPLLTKKIKEKKRFQLYERWSRKVFVDVYVKLLAPLMNETLKEKGGFQGTFMEEASLLCRQLHRLSLAP